jgi:hypothetical protein
MKSLLSRSIYFATAALLLFSACEKDAVQINSVTPQGARVRFYNFAPSGPGVLFYINDVKISAVLSTTGVESAAGLTVPNVFPASNYCVVPDAANAEIKAKISPAATADPGITTASLTTTLVKDKNYSVYTSGVYTAKKSDMFIIEDPIPAPDTSGNYVRLVQTIANLTGPVNLVIKNTVTAAEIVVATNVAYKSASPYVKIPGGVYDLYLRYPSQTTNIVTRTGLSLLKGQANTIGARGTTGGYALDNTVNR